MQENSDPQEQWIELTDRGVTLCVARAGQGTPLLVLNGTGSDLRNAPNALRWPIAKHFDVVTFDHRVLGRSEQHEPDYQPTMADFAADVLALCDSLAIAEFSAIGFSFGGMVAQELAIAAGDRLTSLALCCTSSGGAGGSSYPLHDLYAAGKTTDEIFDLWDVRSATDPAVRKNMEAIFAAGDDPVAPAPGLLKQIEARRHHDTWDRLGAISAPTLVAYGLHDGVAPPLNSERMSGQIPNASLAPFDGGHLFQWQDRTAWPTLIDFLR